MGIEATIDLTSERCEISVYLFQSGEGVLSGSPTLSVKLFDPVKRQRSEA